MTPISVFDCMVLLQAAANPQRAAGACVAAVETGLAVLVVSPATMAELDDVIHRPNVRARMPTLTDATVASFLAKLRGIATVLPVVPPAVTLKRDPKDEKYLNLAVAAGATLVVSRDNDLLDLMTGTDADAVDFRTRFPAIAIVDPPEFLHRLRTGP